ncbi:MAG: autotransporter assembly complex family protein [Amaricoccus sp.]|uniref:autotransporter assembly complex protein TamA n=1 Tax=Amaricoccus sp. TaxID=1872485 RepID=UPI0039E30FD4
MRGLLCASALAAALACPAPAGAFTLLGIHLWGAREDENRVEVIDPLTYTVTLDVTGPGAGLRAGLQRASSLWTGRNDPASGTGGLLSVARGDYRRLLAALYAEGYYGPYVSITIGGKEAADLTLAREFPQDVPVAVRIDTGPLFRFGTAAVVNPPPEQISANDEVGTLDSIGYKTGRRARSAVVTQASALMIEQWRQVSYAKAREADREMLADHANDQLDATLTLDPGRPAHYGPTKVVGTTRTDPAFIAFMAGLPEGRAFDPDDITAGQARLNRLGIFRSLRFEEAPEILDDGSLPMTISVEDRAPRTIGFGGTYSTIDGLGVSAYWMHRNLMGRGERLRFDASVDGLGASLDPQDYDYNLGVTFTKPGVLTPDTDFVTSLVGSKVNYDTYSERSVTAKAGLQQSLGRFITGSVFVLASRSRFDDDFGIRHFTKFGLDGTFQYDRRDNKFDATRGYYLAITADPFYEAEYGNTALQTTIEGRGYLGFFEDRKLVLAARALVGTYVGASIEESPPDMLFFAGGGGSIRGYSYRSIGVPFTNADGVSFTAGGRGIVEASGEVRYRFTDNWGAVAFVDTGFVTADPTLSGDSDFKTGTGLGVRYYTPIGVLRGDLATPLERASGDSRVALYIGIGQAF